MSGDVTFLAALIAGLVSFLSPCVLPLVPPYLVFLAGTSLERFADKEPEPRVKRETVAAAALFVLGFSTVFVALGASASVIGSLIRVYSGPLATIAGVVIIIMGLHFLGVTPIALLHRQKRLDCKSRNNKWNSEAERIDSQQARALRDRLFGRGHRQNGGEDRADARRPAKSEGQADDVSAP